jgi:hypothetical protein
MATITKELTESMTMITREDLNELSEFHNAFCVSVYLPTHRAGEHTLRGEDALNLKNQLKDIRFKLEQMGMHGNQLENFLKPVKELVYDNTFWRYQAEGLAIFLSEDYFRTFNVPVQFEELNYISIEFYLKPLLPLFNDDGLFYLLTLKRDEVKLFEAQKYNISEVDISEVVPLRLEERVGYDFEQKQLQFRTQWGGNKPGSFHGHGENEWREKNELLMFFQAIDRGIMSILHDKQQYPLVVCCLDRAFPIYKDANTHTNLYPENISANPADLDVPSLHEKGRNLLHPYFMQHLEKSKDRMLQGLAKRKSSSDIGEIIPAAIQGRIDTLFLGKNYEVYGIYKPESNEVEIHPFPVLPAVSLTNLAAKRVFEQGGRVYILEKRDMPDIMSDISAFFRY